MAKLDKLVEKASEHLDDGEEVVSAVLGQYETERAGQDSVRKGVLVATDRRVVLYAKKLGGYELESFPYDNISSIEMGKQMVMGHSIKLFASGNEVRLKWIDKKQDVPVFISAVRGRMKGGIGSGTGAPAQAAEQDVSEQIRKLAQLRDDDILTDDEFQAKKTQLLGL
jgi:hypothetical protein